MKILVVLRMMPDPASELQIADDGLSLDREWLDFKLNDFDDQALEEAILLKEAVGAKVIALALGEGARPVLQMAVARGADVAMEMAVDADAMICSRSIATGIAEIARTEGIDLILTGVQSSEDIYGQVAPYLASLLDWPCLSGTSRVALVDTGLTVSQERGGGAVSHFQIDLPAVLGVQTASKAPRYVSGSKLREASKTPIGSAQSAAPGLPATGQLISLGTTKRTGQGENLGDRADAAAARLIDVLKLANLGTGVGK